MKFGKSKPTIENLFKLADYFNCSIDYLLGRTNITTPINSIANEDIETAKIIEQYKSLTSENKEHFLSYLQHLNNVNKK